MYKHYYILIKSVSCFTLMVTKHTNIFLSSLLSYLTSFFYLGSFILPLTVCPSASNFIFDKSILKYFKATFSLLKLYL